MSERFANDLESAWREMDRSAYDRVWDRFYEAFRFRAGVTAEDWPAISEPVPSLTLDLSVIPNGPERGAAYDAINAEALRAFVWALPDVTEMAVLDWHHPAYWFTPATQALTWQGEWKVPVYPDGDYFVFLSDDFADGTFGHPWEQTLCIMGERLIHSLGRSLTSWLPIKRRDGQPV